MSAGSVHTVTQSDDEASGEVRGKGDLCGHPRFERKGEIDFEDNILDFLPVA